MTLPYSISKCVFLGNGVSTDFPIHFRVWDKDQLNVLLIDPQGVESTAVGWSVDLHTVGPNAGDAGGTLTYLHEGAPLPWGWKLAALRTMPFTQDVNLITGTRFDPQVIEDALDRATAERQQLLESVSRAVLVEVGSDVTPEALIQSLKASVQLAAKLSFTGDIRLLPFRNTELPHGWYFCDGTRYGTATAQGMALMALSNNYTADWGITLEGSGAGETINVPTLFHADGRGCLIRAVDGISRQVGTLEQDALQNITGTVGNVVNTGTIISGAFYADGTAVGYYSGGGAFAKVLMDASRLVRTAEETRPLNVGMTPAIFLGV